MSEETVSEPAPPSSYPVISHKWYEDVLAVLFAALLIGTAVVFYTEAQLVTGGVSGLSLVLSYVFEDVSFGTFFFFLNMPFYALAIIRMGWRFTIKTIAAVGLVSIFPTYMADLFVIDTVHPVFAAVFAGALVAMGMIALFRHGSGIGGVSILAHLLQEKGVMRAGWFLLAVDLTILAGAAFVLPIPNLIYSVIGAVVLNVFVGMNHRPGRYFGK
ncbi:MAG: hypothetical protein CMK07_07205 [Ponticaulis sp.]|nr:hypothetical protein [Ponticaulis sp.]